MCLSGHLANPIPSPQMSTWFMDTHLGKMNKINRHSEFVGIIINENQHRLWMIPHFNELLSTTSTII